MAVSSVHQRELVEVSFRLLDGKHRIHPALAIYVDELQETEEGMLENFILARMRQQYMPWNMFVYIMMECVRVYAIRLSTYSA